MSCPFPPPPRELSKQLRRTAYLGSTTMVASLSSLFLVNLVLILLLLVYDVWPSHWRVRNGDSVTVVSSIDAIIEKPLPSGGMTTVVKASVKVNEKLLQVTGYGPRVQQSRLGEPVTIVIPTSNPQLAYLQGYSAYAVEPQVLVQMAVLFCGPGLLGIGWSLLKARRRLLLLKLGKECRATLVRHVPLPRPLRDKSLAQWTWVDDGATFRGWFLEDVDPPQETSVLCLRGRALNLASTADTISCDHETLVCRSLLAKVAVGLNLAIAVIGAGLWLLYASF